MAHTNDCVCGDGRWRFETTDLATGRTKGVLHPISADWEEKHSQPGQGSILLAPRDVSAEDIWSHDTALYISQVIDGVRVGRWAGLFEAYDADSNGNASIGLQGIDEYLFHRLVAAENGGILFGSGSDGTKIPQTQIGVGLVQIQLEDQGIPLVPLAGETLINREYTINPWELKNIGEAITQLTEMINGPKYKLEHKFLFSPEEGGYWYTEITFQDRIGEDRGIELRGDIEGATYGVNVSAKDHATWVYGLGEGSEADQKMSIAYDSANIYPKFQHVESFSGVSIQETLDNHTIGYLVDHRDPVATPSMTIPGLHPTPENLQLGDLVKISFDYGLAKFDGEAYLLSIGWSLRDGSPVTRALTFQPKIRSSSSVRTQTSTRPPAAATPTATAGAVSNLQDPRITDSAGMTHSKTS